MAFFRARASWVPSAALKLNPCLLHNLSGWLGFLRADQRGQLTTEDLAPLGTQVDGLVRQLSTKGAKAFFHLVLALFVACGLTAVFSGFHLLMLSKPGWAGVVEYPEWNSVLAMAVSAPTAFACWLVVRFEQTAKANLTLLQLWLRPLASFEEGVDVCRKALELVKHFSNVAALRDVVVERGDELRYFHYVLMEDLSAQQAAQKRKDAYRERCQQLHLGTEAAT